jgi:fatty acid desaturase
MVHNHVHLPVFKSRVLNGIYDYWLTIIYGYGVFAWISTHNRNHHVYNNKPGDFAPPFIHSEKNNLFTLLSYPTVSGIIQHKVNYNYLKELWRADRPRCLFYCSQFVVLAAFTLGAFLLNWKKALLYVVIPQQIALNVVLMFNYLQHIHCDEESKFNHSRNVVSPRMNWFLLNNGYHTAHHLKPLLHWSELKRLHGEIEHRIDPELNEPSLTWMVARMYLLAPFVPALRGEDLRARRLGRGAGVAASPVG